MKTEFLEESGNKQGCLGEFGPGTLMVTGYASVWLLGAMQSEVPEDSQNESVWSGFLMGLCWGCCLDIWSKGQEVVIAECPVPQKAAHKLWRVRVTHKEQSTRDSVYPPIPTRNSSYSAGRASLGYAFYHTPKPIKLK